MKTVKTALGNQSGFCVKEDAKYFPAAIGCGETVSTGFNM